MLTHLEVEDRTAPATWDNPGRDHARHPSRRCCCVARAGADGMGGARRRAGREWQADRRARSACRPERPIAPPASPAAADAVRPALGKARSRPVQPGAGRSRTGNCRERGRTGEGRSGAAQSPLGQAPLWPRPPARPPAAGRDRHRAERHHLPVLRRRDACNRRGLLAAPRPHSGAIPGDRHAPPEIRLPRLPGSGGPGTGVGAAVEGGLPTERLVAQVVVAKYADHCPLYRQAQILARQGIAIDRATLAFWVGYAAAEIRPVWRLLRDELLSSTKLFVDETTAPVLDPGRGRTKKGYFWVLARDDRPWRGGAPPAVVYSYAPGRSGEYAVRLLQGYTGVLQTDGYAAYRSLSDPKRAGGPATLAFCWAHWRRQWFDIAKSPPAPTATEALKRIAELYEIVRAHTQSLPCAFSVGWPQEIVSSTPGKPRLNAVVLRRSQSICLSGFMVHIACRRRD